MFRRSVSRPKTPVAAASVLGAFLLLAACGGGSSQSSNQNQNGSGQVQHVTVFTLGGIFKVNLHYGDFVYGSECPASMKSGAQPFDVSYRASADGSSVTFKNLGEGFDLMGTGQPDGTLNLSGGYSPVQGVNQSGTLTGKWTPDNLNFAATIAFEVTPLQGPKVTCSVKARATGSASATT